MVGIPTTEAIFIIPQTLCFTFKFFFKKPQIIYDAIISLRQQHASQAHKNRPEHAENMANKLFEKLLPAHQPLLNYFINNLPQFCH